MYGRNDIGAIMKRTEEQQAHETVSREALHARLAHASHRIRQQSETMSGRQKRMQALADSQTERASVLNTAQHAFLVIGGDDTIRYANPVFRSISKHLFGRVPQPGYSVHDFIRDQDQASFDANLARARHGETVDIVRPSSSVREAGEKARWFRFVYAPVSWEAETGAKGLKGLDSACQESQDSGWSHLVVMHVEDITQQRVSGQALERSLERHRSLVKGALDSVASAIFIADADEQVVWANQQAELFFQFPRESVLGQDRSRVIQHYLAPRVEDPDAFEHKLHEPSGGRSTPRDDSGFVCRVRPTEAVQERVLEYRTIPIECGIYAGGRIEHFYDITQLKETEQQLLDAKLCAEQSKEQTRRFLSTVSHEVRTAAAGILGFAELLLEKDLDEEAHYFTELIEENGRSLLGLLSNVLDFARIETGTPISEDQPFSPEKCGRQALDAIRSLAIQKDLDLDLHVTNAVPRMVLADPVRLRQVLTNLLSNAVKFTDEGHVSVHVDAVPHESSRDEEQGTPGDLDLLVSVCDTGIGISREAQSHLFEAFFQAELDPCRQVDGSGLGLYIVGRLVDGLNGSIALDSAPGAGSRFHLRIPVRRLS